MEPRFDSSGTDAAHANLGANAGGHASASTGAFPYQTPYSRHNSFSEGSGFDSVWGFIQDVAANQAQFIPPVSSYNPQYKYQNPMFTPYQPPANYRPPTGPPRFPPVDYNSSQNPQYPSQLSRSSEFTPIYRLDEPYSSNSGSWRQGGYSEDSMKHHQPNETQEQYYRSPSPHWTTGPHGHYASQPQDHSHHHQPPQQHDASPRFSTSQSSSSQFQMQQWPTAEHGADRDGSSTPVHSPTNAAAVESSPDAMSSSSSSSSGRHHLHDPTWTPASARTPPAASPRPLPRKQLPTFNPVPEPANMMQMDDYEAPLFSDERSSESTKLKTLFRVDLGGYAIPSGLSKSLSRPVFAPRAEARKYMLGAVASEETDENLRDKNQLVFFQFDRRKIREAPSVVDQETYNVPVIWKYSLSEGVRDILWTDEHHLFLALGHRITMVQLGADLNVCEACDFPSYHSDDIREMAMRDMHLLLSGGFDGNVFVTDVVKLTDSIRRNDTAGRNRVYRCGSTVGSVSWHPSEQFLASCTTDNGTVRIFDIRTEKHSAALNLNTGENDLYCHAYKDNGALLLGYGNGTMRVFDYRMNRTTAIFDTTCLDAIGEIKWDVHTGTFAIFGLSKMSIWQYSQGVFSLWSESAVGLDGIAEGRTSGNFIRGTNLVGVTTSEGSFALMDYSGRVGAII